MTWERLMWLEFAGLALAMIAQIFVFLTRATKPEPLAKTTEEVAEEGDPFALPRSLQGDE
ncbi:MAG: hypothetical protein UU07_C0020G0005 [Parcubacteria group bacterium GW2011_GWF1_40_5]|nr:MAG: hypothetical protein UU07_C0020G0005 [Parcubacteria group bacterium GW2011_GWF1_40_5]